VSPDPYNNINEYCIPNGDKTCYCRDTCSIKPQWWNCTNVINGGIGVYDGSSCDI
jgi:hypothetical protein